MQKLDDVVRRRTLSIHVSANGSDQMTRFIECAVIHGIYERNASSGIEMTPSKMSAQLTFGWLLNGRHDANRDLETIKGTFILIHFFSTWAVTVSISSHTIMFLFCAVVVGGVFHFLLPLSLLLLLFSRAQLY